MADAKSDLKSDGKAAPSAWKSVTVKNGQNHELVIPILTDQIVKWKWKLAGYELGFAARFLPSSSNDAKLAEVTEVVKASRVTTAGDFTRLTRVPQPMSTDRQGRAVWQLH